MTMRMMTAAAVAVAAMAPTAVARATTTAPAVVETAPAPDPARLALAREVVDLAYPPATREAMFAGVMHAVTPMMQNMVDQNPELKAAFARDPRVRAIFDRYLAKIQARVSTQLNANIPALFAAYGRAYARRFDLKQLGDLKAFFATPTGALYTSRSLSLLTDPDVLAANATMMRGAMGDMRSDAQALVAEIKALPPLPGQNKP